jgi:hypothetical protein
VALYSAREDNLARGTTIILNSRLSDKVYEHGVLVRGRAQYITFMLTDKVKVGIICIYGFSHTGSRASLWQRLAEYELREAKWVLEGNFNFIESLEDKIGGQPKTNRGSREIDG